MKVQRRPSSDEEAEETSTESEEEFKSTVHEDTRIVKDSSGLGKLQPGEIPDTKYIQAARKRRETARKRADFIPLDSLAKDDSSMSPVRDDDPINDDELDDHERRIDFTEGLKTQRQRMAEEIGVNESDESFEGEYEDEEEDDQKLWEEQQIKRVNISQLAGRDVDTEPRRNMRRMLNTLESLPPIRLETVKKQLTNRLESLQEVYRSHQREHEKIQSSTESSMNTIEQLEDASDTNRRYKFYREMGTYVQNLTNCLSEKILLINELESAMHHLLRQQATRLLQRRQEDVQDESTSIQQLSNKANGNTQSHADCIEEKQCRIERRMTQRAQRQQRRKVTGKEADHRDGMSSDDEVPPDDLIDFNEKKDQILTESKTIFEDVHEDYCSADRILAKFGFWRHNFPASYYDAYIGLSLPKILNPLIRAQLIAWNPLEAGCSDLVGMPWVSAVEQFCHDEAEEYQRKENSDMKLLSTVIEKTIVPKIEGFIIHVWDPLSSSQTQNFVQLCAELKEEFAVFKDESKATQMLSKSIIMRIRISVEEDVFIPLYSKSVLEDRTSAHSVFQERQFWSAVKLLGNIFQWDGLLPEQVLQEVGLDKLLNRYILLALQMSLPGPDNIEKCKKVINCFPPHWFEELKTQQTLPQLESLCRYLLQSIRAAYKNGGQSEESSSNRKAIEEMVKMLAQISAVDHTKRIIDECKLEDLKSILERN
ncbi:intron Large complex component GCFC2 isoform X1 [Callorhinchus milii]|nr:intron Large complex component GCFC2 isoform X1 [Callorhinchus milii]